MNYLIEENFCPNAFHRELAKEKNLAGDNLQLTEEYFTLSLFYRNLLEAYLGNVLGLKNLDAEITNSNLKFEAVPKEDKDVYQMFSCYQYIYLRNTIYIEKLTVQDLQFLREKMAKKDVVLNEETIEFLKRTYPLLITSDLTKEDSITNYGPLSSSYFAPTNALVFGLRSSDDFEATDEEWLKINVQQQNYLEQLKERLNQEMVGKLNVPVQFLLYDDESIKKNELSPNL